MKGATRFAASMLALLPFALYSQTPPNYHVDYIDVNNLFLWTATNGMTSHNPYTDGAGLEFPKGSGQYVMFMEGLVWGGLVEGELRVGGSTYRFGLQPGKILPDGTPANPTDPHYHIYKVRRLTQTKYDQLIPADQDRLRKDFIEWPVEDGAPWVDADANGIYEPDFDTWVRGQTTTDYPYFEGDEVLWWVSNDLDAILTNRLYGTSPVGLEIQSTFWAHDEPGMLGNTVFMKHRFINKSMKNYSDVYIGKWADPDVGDAFDDFVGMSEACQIGYAYNGEDYDSVYAERPPAVGHVLLQGPMIPRSGSYAMFNGKVREGFMNLPVSSFIYYINGDGVYVDPSLGNAFGATMLYRYLTCLMWNGKPIIDPVTGMPQCLALSGDPITRTGWIDGHVTPPGDRRALMSAGPFDLAPGDTEEVVYAVTVAQGTSRLNSVELLLQNACALRSEWRSQIPVSVPPVASVPEFPALNQVYPNPAVGGTASVEFVLPERSYVTLQITNVLGQNKGAIYAGVLERGNHHRELTTAGLPPGLYLVTLRTSQNTVSQSMVVR